MAGGQERLLRGRIRSIQSIRKITRAMELIAASRIVRAQNAIAAARPYTERLGEVVGDLARAPDSRAHPLFRQPDEVRRAAVIVISGDRGLAGGYNSTVLRVTERLLRSHNADGHDTLLVTVGRKAQGYFRFRGYPIAHHFTGISDRPTFADARRVVATVMEPFAEGELDMVEIVFTRFNSLASQTVTSRRLIPLADGEDEGRRRRPEAAARDDQDRSGQVDFEFEPDPADILDRLLPSWLEAQVLAALLESAASEHAARQRAMKAATDNADELTKTLRRVMNRARQDAITTEIMEIVGGAEALRSARAGSQGGFRAQTDSDTTARPA